MKKLTRLVIVFLFVILSKVGQTQNCADTTAFTQSYIAGDFEDNELCAFDDGTWLEIFVIRNDYLHYHLFSYQFIYHNANGQIRWSKKISLNTGYSNRDEFSDQVFGNSCKKLSDGSLFFIVPSREMRFIKYFLAKIDDNTGDLILNRTIKINSMPYQHFGFGTFCEDKNTGDIFLLRNYSFVLSNTITKLTRNLDVVWTKIISAGALKRFASVQLFLDHGLIRGDDLLIFSSVEYSSERYETFVGPTILRLDKRTGQIKAQHSFWYSAWNFSNVLGELPLRELPGGKIAWLFNGWLYSSVHAGTKILWDSSLDVIESGKIMIPPTHMGAGNISGMIDSSGNMAMGVKANVYMQGWGVFAGLLDTNNKFRLNKQIRLPVVEPGGIDVHNAQDRLNLYVNNIIDTAGTLSNTISLLADQPDTSVCNVQDSSFFRYEPLPTPDTTRYFTMYIAGDEPTFYDSTTWVHAQAPVPQTVVLCKKIYQCQGLKITGDSLVCTGAESSMFKAATTNCNRQINWLPDTASYHFKLVNDSTAQLHFDRAGSFWVRAGISNCGLKDSVQIHVTAPMPKPVLGNDTMLCPGKQLVLNAGTGYKTYAWNSGNSTPAITIKQAGIYSVRVTDSCGIVSGATIKILYDDKKLSAGKPFVICQGYDTILTASSGFKTYAWSGKGIRGDANQQHISVIPEGAGMYYVTAGSEAGCVYTDSVVIATKFCPQQIWFPTAFTPNGDGLNDIFRPLIDGRLLLLKLQVFNRWGQLVYETAQLNTGWNGHIKNVPQPAGNYTWKCTYKMHNQELEQASGSLLLIR